MGAGTDRDWLEQLLGYWADGFDWPSVEPELNRFAHYRAQVWRGGGALRG